MFVLTWSAIYQLSSKQKNPQQVKLKQNHTCCCLKKCRIEIRSRKKNIFDCLFEKRSNTFYLHTEGETEPRSRRTEGETNEYLEMMCSKIPNISLTPVFKRGF